MPVLPVDYDDQEQEYETTKTKRGMAREYVITHWPILPEQ